MLPDDITEAHKMIEDLRKENGDRRVKAKRYDDAFTKFNESEREYLVDLISCTGDNPDEGAKGFRDLAFRMIGDPAVFLDGLDLPTAPTEEEPEAKITTDEAGTNMTPEQMKAILDERDAASATSAAEAAKAAEEEAEIESVFAEIEALGFERDTPAFLAVLNMGGAMATTGTFDGFEALAPKVKMAFDMAPDPDPSTTEADAPVVEAEGSGKAHASTAEAGGSPGAATENKKDWVQEAKDNGVDVMQAARDRAENRLYD